MAEFNDRATLNTPELLGQIVRALRLSQGFTVTQLGAASGLEPANLSRFERGVPGGIRASKHLDLLAHRLGTRASTLYAIAEHIPHKPSILEDPAELTILATELSEIIQNYLHLSESDRDEIRRIALGTDY